MKMFKCLISSSSAWDPYNQLIKDYPALNDFGFTIEKSIKLDRSGKPYNDDKAFIFISSLDDVFNLIDKTDRIIISVADHKWVGTDVDYEIEIYDGWRE